MYIKAIKHIRRLRGGSQAQLMAADDGHEYVVKFQGNPQTTRVLANDYLAVGPNGRIERTRAGHHICRCRDHSGIQDPAPDFVGDSRPGDDLYTACVLAINPDTGKIKWHFQFTPHDMYDYDANETPVLVDLEDNGKIRHLLLQANRNGFFYVLDRTNGKFLQATPFVEKINWATGIDASGRPVLSGRIP